MKTHKLVLGTLISLALAGVGCGGSGGGGAGDDGSDTPDAPAAPTCNLVGTWTLPAMGGAPPTFTVASGGTWNIALGTVGTKTGTWSVTADRVSFTDTGATGVGSQSQCPSAQVGVYSMVYAAGCNSLTMHLVTDPCANRVSIVDGLTVTR